MPDSAGQVDQNVKELTLDCSAAIREQLVRGAHLDQYFGVWSIYEPAFKGAIAAIESLDLSVHLSKQATEPQSLAGGVKVEAADQVAVIRLQGPLMKHASSLTGGTSTVLARRQLRAAVQDDTVSAILLAIDSPGGTAAGTKDLADDVAWAASKKPLYAYIEDLGASAAYWIASAAAKTYANQTALVGSIGTFAVIEDLSGRAAQLGIKVHVVKAGAFKGTGVAGTEVSAEQLGEMQRVVDSLNEHFLAGVSSGRKLSAARVKQLADGRVHIAAAATELGLIDGVRTFDQVLSELSDAARTRRNTSRQEMSDTNTAPKAATAAELEAACTGADEKFLFAQLKSGATVDQAKSAWIGEMNARLAASRAETEQAKASANKPGVDPLPAGGKAGAKAASGADPIDAFNDAVAEKMAAGMKKPKAISAVARENPELHESYIAAYNEAHKPSRRRAG